MIYNKIYDFCKVKTNGGALNNGTEEYPPRVKFIIKLLDSLNIKYEIDTFLYKKNNLHNIYLRGTSDKWIMAHHDIINPNSDNANDNSASVINAIALKQIRPDMNIALVDGEEPPCMGAGSNRFADRVQEGYLNVNWVLNFELTGVGGEYFFVGNYKNTFTNKIVEKFNCPVMNAPFNDASILLNRGIMAALINPVPLKKGKETYEILKMDGVVNFVPNIFKYLNKEFKVGDKLSKTEIEDIEYYIAVASKDVNKIDLKIPIFEYSEKETEEIKLSPGQMPTLNQLDTSILWRCHSIEDSLDHIKTEDMKLFVERVVTVICEL